MRILISEFISLLGVVQAPGGRSEDTGGGFRHGGCSMPYFDLGAWPERAGDPFADGMNSIQKWRRPRHRGVRPAGEARRLRQRHGRASPARAPLAADLVDELALTIEPIALGGKNRSGRTTKGELWLRDILTQCAWTAARTRDAYLAAQFWRLSCRVTAPENLVLLCSRHHHRFHHPGWHLKLRPDATLEVTDPTGRVRTTDPPGW